MFIGHFAVGFAAKRAAPKISLATMLFACQLADLLWPVLVLGGIERVRVDATATAFTPFDFEYYPWSHGLVMSLVWGLLVFGALKLLRRATVEASIVAAVVISHWILDALTHRPDVPLAFGEARVGLGLWDSVPLTLGVELVLFAVGIGLYANSTRPRSRMGSWSLWTLVAFLLLVYLANAFGPTPAADTPAAVIASPALAMWLIVLWGVWVDRTRMARSG
jgi:hypothetical protein